MVNFSDANQKDVRHYKAKKEFHMVIMEIFVNVEVKVYSDLWKQEAYGSWRSAEMCTASCAEHPFVVLYYYIKSDIVFLAQISCDGWFNIDNVLFDLDLWAKVKFDITDEFYISVGKSY